jgi:hypothetical protein
VSLQARVRPSVQAELDLHTADRRETHNTRHPVDLFLLESRKAKVEFLKQYSVYQGQNLREIGSGVGRRRELWLRWGGRGRRKEDKAL